MRHFNRKRMKLLALAVLAAALAGCTSDISLSDFNLSRTVSSAVGSNPLAFQAARANFTLRPVTSDDLVGPQGQCSSGAVTPSAVAVDSDGQPTGAPAFAQGGVALQMTECEVVQRAGAPDRVEFGNEGGERAVVLTYAGGARPGIYRFTGGRLSSIERGAEAPAPKAQKKSAPAKKRPPA
jgi:hypothetical protein